MASRKRSLSSEDDDNTLDLDELDEPEYSVDRLLAERKGLDGITRYLVLWDGYDDDQASWEPSESFNDAETTLRDWHRQVAEGDVLDADHLAELELRIEARQEREAQQEEQSAESLVVKESAKRSNVLGLNTNPFSRRDSQHDQRLPKRPKVRPQVTLSKHIAQSPTSRNLPRPKPKISSSTESAARTRQIDAGTPFRNLKHMGNARKKAAQERPVNPDDPNLKFVFSNNQSGTVRSPSADSALFFPESIAAPEKTIEESADPDAGPSDTMVAPVSISKTGSAPASAGSSTDLPTMNRTLLTKRRMSAPSKDVADTISNGLNTSQVVLTAVQNTDCDRLSKEQPTSIQSPKDARLVEPQRHEANSSAPVVPQTSIIQTTKTGRNGRTWGKDEIVVHLSYGDHDIGAVRIVNLVNKPRFDLISWKRTTDVYDIRMRFTQEQVLNPSDPLTYRAITASFTDLRNRPAWIAPYVDTADACHQFAHDYLKKHDLAPVWYLPGTSWVFVLFSPQSPSYARNKRYHMNPLPDLMIEVFEHRGPSPAIAQGSNKGLCWFWARGNCERGSDCPFVHEQASKAANGMITPGEFRAEASGDQSQKRSEGPKRAQTFSDNDEVRPDRRERRNSMPVATSPSMDTVANQSVVVDPRNVPKQMEKKGLNGMADAGDVGLDPNVKSGLDAKVAANVQDSSATAAVDWTFDYNLSTLMKPIKDLRILASKTPLIFIAFPETYSHQSEAFKTWAKKHTDGRKIYVSQDWPDLQEVIKTDIPKLYFFHESDPIYTGLENFFESLHRKELLCYDVKWSEEADAAKVTYQLEPLFVRGHAVLLLEEVIFSSPAAALQVLDWVYDGCGDRGIMNTLVVRPSIVSWLNRRIDDLSGEDEVEDLECIIKLLGVINKFSPFDVTIPGRRDRLIQVLDTSSSNTTSKLHSFPELPLYDASPGASMELDAIRARDEFLIDYFVGLATDEAARYRRFLVLHAGQSTRPANAQHIAFRSGTGFANQIDGSRKK